MLGPQQLINIPFSGGVDEKTRAEQVGPGSMLTLENWTVTKNGAYQKAPGNVSVGTTIIGGGSLTGVKRVFGFRDELLVSDGTYLYSRSPTADAWRKVGLVPACTVLPRIGIGSVPNNGAVTSSAIVNVGGYIVVAWTTTDTLYWTIVDGTSYGVVASGTVVITGAVVCGGSVGATAMFFYTQLTNTGLRLLRLNTASLTSPATTALLQSDVYVNTTQPIDCCTLSDRVVIAYYNSSGTANSITARSYNAAGAELANNTSIACVNPPSGGAIGIAGLLTDTVYIGSSEAANVTAVRGLNPTTLAVTATKTTVIAYDSELIGIARTGQGTGFIWTWDLATSPLRVHTNVFSISAGAISVAGTGPYLIPNMVIASKPFQVGTRWYGMAYALGPQLPVLGLPVSCVDITDFTTGSGNGGTRAYPMASIAPGAAELLAQVGTMPGVAALSATKFATLNANITTLSNGNLNGSMELVMLDFANPQTCQPALYGSTLCLSGGTPYAYDGATTFEIGYIPQPAITSTLSGGSGLTGIYNYAMIYEWFDAAGQRHQSAPSPLLLVTVTAQAVTIHGNRLSMTARTTPVHGVLYRTSGDAAPPTGTILHRVPGSETLADTSSGVFSATFAFPADTLTDPGLIVNETLYAQPELLGTALPRTAPSSLTSLVAHQDRITGVGDDGYTVWVSGQQIAGTGIWFSAAGMRYPQQRGPITALASMDGRLVAWTRDGVTLLDGQGPPDSGQGGDYITSNLVSAVGCIDQRSVAVTMGGAIFQSLRGIERLNRSLQVENYFGARVETTQQANPVITSAIVQGARGRVVFSCLPSEGSATGTDIQYDYVNDVWSVCPRMSSSGVQSAAMIGNNAGTVPVYFWATAAGAVWQESTATYLDNASYKNGIVVTPWIHTTGLVGWQHVDALVLLAQSVEAHSITISVAYDYSDSYTDTETWTDTQIAAFTTSREQLQIDLSRPECTAFRVKVEDAKPAVLGVGNKGQGPILIGIQAIARADDGLVKLPEGNRQ